MSGHSTYQPQSAFMKWIERRLPIAGLVHSSFVAYPTPRNLNYWWTFGGILAFMLGVADHHRRRAGDALHAACRHGLQFRRAHHARRELRLAAALPALQRRLDVLPRRLHPHVPRHVLRLLQGAARGAVDPRRHPLPADDGDRLPRLHAALGPDELLGRDRHHQFLLGHPGGRRQRSSTWLWGGYAVGNPTLQPLLLAALSSAVRDRRRGRAAHLGAACRRAEQSDRHRAEDRQGHRGVHALCHRQGRLHDGRCSASCSPGSCSTCRTISAMPTTTSRPIRR